MKKLINKTGLHCDFVCSLFVIALMAFPVGRSFCQEDSSAAPMTVDISAEELIKKHIQALGGEAKLSAIRDEIMEADMTTSLGSMDIAAEMIQIRKAPNKTYMHTSMLMMNQKQETEMWCDGKTCVMSFGFGGTNRDKTLTGDELEEALEGYQFNEFLHYKELGYTATVKEKKLMDGKPIYVLELKRKHGTGQFGISAETFLMAGIKKNQDTPAGKQLVFIRYSDYQAVNGVMYPFKMSMGMEQMSVETKVKSYRLNTDVPDAMFVKK